MGSLSVDLAAGATGDAADPGLSQIGSATTIAPTTSPTTPPYGPANGSSVPNTPPIPPRSTPAREFRNRFPSRAHPIAPRTRGVRRQDSMGNPFTRAKSVWRQREMSTGSRQTASTIRTVAVMLRCPESGGRSDRVVLRAVLITGARRSAASCRTPASRLSAAGPLCCGNSHFQLYNRSTPDSPSPPPDEPWKTYIESQATPARPRLLHRTVLVSDTDPHRSRSQRGMSSFQRATHHQSLDASEHSKQFTRRARWTLTSKPKLPPARVQRLVR